MKEGFKTCPVDGCANTIAADLVACAPHWYRLPSGLRARIWKHYRANPGGPDHRQAISEAIDLLNHKSKPKETDQ
ncbi:MAG: hypothetical protein ACIALR_04225 [Blastopirellula sp. JB062]